MYQVEASKALLKPSTWASPAARLSVPRNVVLLGLVSMLTDISAEMVATVLPLYLVFSLGVTPLVLGAIDGLYRGAAAIVQVGSGLVSDRWQRHKEVAAIGYGLSAICKVGLVAVGSSVGAIGALVATDRLGKGLRTAPRDALISLSSTKAALATSFGVHRAMDSAGAMLGPLVAFGILLAAPARFDAVFVVSTLFAFLGLAVLVLAVQGRPERAPRTRSTQPLRAVAADVLRDARFRILLIAAGGLAVASVSDALIYVGLQRQTEFDPTVFPLLYVVTAVVFMALAIPVGRLADRGRPRPGAARRPRSAAAGLRRAPALGRNRCGMRFSRRPRRLLCGDGRGHDGAGGSDTARAVSGQRHRSARDSHQPRTVRILARLWRALVRAWPAERGA